MVSEAEFDYIKPGMRVAVPFGKSKIYTGLAVDKHQKPPVSYDAKEIHQILDSRPIVTVSAIKLWFWISEYYMAPMGAILKTALPSAFLLESETILTFKNEGFVDEKTFSDEEFLVYEALQNQSSITIEDVTKILNKKNIFPIIQKLIDKNLLVLNEEMVEEYKPKLTRYVRLQEEFRSEIGIQNVLEIVQKSSKQKALLLTYYQLQAQTQKPVSIKELLDKSKTTSAVIKTLLDKNILETYHVQEDRVDFSMNKKPTNLILSPAQTCAYHEIKKSFESQTVCLLHGITASGKTEIYMRLIEDYLEKNQQVLYLLPEIALTTQLVSRLTRHFGNQVAVFHSKYSNQERVEVWNQVLDSSEKSKIVIGTRSALFLPFNSLGLIIIDEEHETTFKQEDPAPRYHARDAAIVLANLHQSKVLLGSATPSLESYYNAKSGKYALVELTERYKKATLPQISLIDLKDAYFRKQMQGHFSFALVEAIANALEFGEQVILFQNRRGFSPVLECSTCGHVPQCTSCNVSLTYHKFKNQLRCHYCGYSISKPTNCHACTSVDINTKGFGTEQIELEVAALFPTKNVKRMDQDTTRGKYSFEKLIDSFKNREIDILVGTQMIAKGLDFENVSLVGILNADSLLYQPDFRAFERSFQLITQVAGRAGRADKVGKVVIQTYNIQSPIIVQVTNNDYHGMYENQLYDRKIYHYPPFCRLIKIILKHRDFEKLKLGSFWLFEVLKQNLQIPVLGPEEPAVNRIRNEYIRSILIKIPGNQNLVATKKTISKVLNSFDAISQYRSIKIAVNVDFY